MLEPGLLPLEVVTRLLEATSFSGKCQRTLQPDFPSLQLFFELHHSFPVIIGEAIEFVGRVCFRNLVPFVFLLLLVGLGYFVGGAAFGARRKGEPLKKGPAMLKVHPHYGKWLQLHGLVQDGVNFSRARIDAKRGVKRTSYATVSQRPAAPRGDVQHEGHSGGTGGTSKRSGKEAKSKSAKPAKSKKSAKSSNAAKDAATDEVPAAETVAEEKERILQEERSAGVHSSQQAIRIVGING